MLWMWYHGVEWDCDVTADVDNGWGIVTIGSDFYAWNVCCDSGLICPIFLIISHSILLKGWIKNGCLCIFEDQRHLRLCLGYVPALAYGSCRVSNQSTALRASNLWKNWGVSTHTHTHIHRPPTDPDDPKKGLLYLSTLSIFKKIRTKFQFLWHSRQDPVITSTHIHQNKI